METVTGVLYYLNKHDITDNINYTDFESLSCVKGILNKKFEDFNISKLYDGLSIVDNFFISVTVGELQDVLNKTDTLRENNLYLISFKHFIRTIVESD